MLIAPPLLTFFKNSKYWIFLWIFLCYNVTLHPPAANLLNILQFSTSMGSSWRSISTTMSHPFALLFSVMLYPVSIFSLTTGSRWSFFKCPQGLSSILQALSLRLWMSHVFASFSFLTFLFLCTLLGSLLPSACNEHTRKSCPVNTSYQAWFSFHTWHKLFLLHF